jgi:hypothetical protein
MLHTLDPEAKMKIWTLSENSKSWIANSYWDLWLSIKRYGMNVFVFIHWCDLFDIVFLIHNDKYDLLLGCTTFVGINEVDEMCK